MKLWGIIFSKFETNWKKEIKENFIIKNSWTIINNFNSISKL